MEFHDFNVQVKTDSREFCKIFENIFLTRHLWTTASGKIHSHFSALVCTVKLWLYLVCFSWFLTSLVNALSVEY